MTPQQEALLRVLLGRVPEHDRAAVEAGVRAKFASRARRANRKANQNKESRAA